MVNHGRRLRTMGVRRRGRLVRLLVGGVERMCLLR